MEDVRRIYIYEVSRVNSIESAVAFLCGIRDMEDVPAVRFDVTDNLRSDEGIMSWNFSGDIPEDGLVKEVRERNVDKISMSMELYGKWAFLCVDLHKYLIALSLDPQTDNRYWECRFELIEGQFRHVVKQAREESAVQRLAALLCVPEKGLARWYERQNAIYGVESFPQAGKMNHWERYAETLTSVLLVSMNYASGTASVMKHLVTENISLLVLRYLAKLGVVDDSFNLRYDPEDEVSVTKFREVFAKLKDIDDYYVVSKVDEILDDGLLDRKYETKSILETMVYGLKKSRVRIEGRV